MEGIEEVCKAPVNLGKPQFLCIGFDEIDGETTVMRTEDEKVAFPADQSTSVLRAATACMGNEFDYSCEVGGECKAWDSGRHPDCEGDDAPDRYERNWCFVDPCSCDADAAPNMSEYLGEAMFQGRPVFYSYWRIAIDPVS